MAKRTPSKKAAKRRDDRLFTLDTYIIGGPITEEFAQKNEVVCRTIQVRGNQTLHALHNAIFDAFDREDEHMYEFQVGGKKPMDPKARCYVLPMAMDSPFEDRKPAGNVTRATIGSLGLKKGQAFYYWFDFGDDWWHQINVAAIEDKAPPGKYPKVIKRVGESPPQYIDWDEEE